MSRLCAEIDARDHTGATALIRAAASAHPQTVYALLQVGADVDLKDRRGKTASGHASANSRTEIVGWGCGPTGGGPVVVPVRSRIIQVLLDHGRTTRRR